MVETSACCSSLCRSRRRTAPACLSAASGDACPWEELIARHLAAPPPSPVPGGPVYHLRAGEQVALVAGHDLSGPLYELITAVLALGEAPS